MKNRGFGVILAIIIVSMLVIIPKNVITTPTMAMSDTTTHNDIVIDGTIGNDWFDGNKTFTPDAFGDETWGTNGEWGLNGLYVAINNTGITFGLNVSMQTDFNGFLLFIDIDQGGHGSPDQNLASSWTRNAVFGNGFRPDYFFGGWGTASWELFNYTDDAGSTEWLNPADYDYKAATGNQTANPTGFSIVHYEGYINWSLLYPNGIPANAQIWVVAAMFGAGNSDSPADLIPDSMNMEAPEEITNYLVIDIDSDGDSLPDLTPEPESIGWAGNEADNSYAGIMPKGFVLEMAISVWMGMHDHPNATNWATLSYRVYDYSAETWGSVINTSMIHVAFDYQGNNDWYRKQLDTSSYDENDTIEWFIVTSYGETTKHNVTIGPLPPIDIGYVGAIDPSGGFKLPGEPIEITVQVGQLLNGTDYIHEAPGTEVTLYYEENNSGTWLTKAFDFREEAGTQNDLFNVTIGPYTYPTNVTFYINATNNNTVLSSNITIYVLVPPEESTIFTMTDPSGDEYGIYPTDESFAPYEGLLDVLNFTVTGNEWVTTFHFQMRNNSNPWSGPSGFSHPTFIVMVDNAPGGFTGSFGNAYVNTDVEWDHGFQVTSWEKWYWNDTEHVQKDGTGISISTDLNVTGNGYWISFSVPTYLTNGAADSSWKYIAMVGSNDYTNFRQHKATAEQWAFGGGNDGDVDPNFVDLLVPAGGNSTWLQEYIANSYDVTTQTRATVMAVGPGITFVEDETDPTVTITSPDDGSEFNITSGTTYDLTVTWTASDPDDATLSGLDRLEFFVDSVLQANITIDDTSATLSLDAGTHTIRINVYDKTGNFGSATITITINAPEETSESEEPTTSGTPGFEIFGLLAMLGLAAMISHRKK